MIQFEVTVTVEGGLHARPAALFVSRASQSNSKITLNKGEKKADGRSILGIMTLGVTQGDHLTIQVDGSDEERVAAEIQELFRQEFAS
ncbi:HPr family phosphocarrier protein [Brevibacillus choshinensis]|uniref:Phosphocarrier protein HPr n=1 Tax=Brevibacillus choshinensis TaxID=54911 RepID=A0ABX7FQ10_BRECH|nr:HPr family phosphocarrier protein [Brevibacillus choshinensis]QRG67737.1 HPr family phosphocarrier protein [Brevibacillus choshinensis]